MFSLNYIPRRPKRNSKIHIKSPADITSTGVIFILGKGVSDILASGVNSSPRHIRAAATSVCENSAVTVIFSSILLKVLGFILLYEKECLSLQSHRRPLWVLSRRRQPARAAGFFYAYTSCRRISAEPSSFRTTQTICFTCKCRVCRLSHLTPLVILLGWYILPSWK